MAEDEPKIENQEKDSPIEELKKRIEDIEMSLGVFNPRNMAGLRTKDLQQATRANLFGDGSDGDVVVSTEIDLTRDMFYNNLTVEEGGIINTKSFRIFVKDQFIKKPGGILRNNGNDGEDGKDGDATNNNLNTGGAAGATVASGSLPGGIASGAGGKGAEGATAGTAGSDADKSLGAAGSGGGGGGNALSGETGQYGGSGGSQTGTLYNILKSFSSAYYLIDTLPSIVSLTISAGSGGGGGGGCSVSADRAGGGGGAGSPAGMIWIAANRMFIEGENEIQCNGGAGGAGGDAIGASSAGGGGGGAGGSGGVIILIYGDKTGTGTLSVAGGAGGDGGSGVAGGYDGSPGSVGQTGQTYEIKIQ